MKHFVYLTTNKINGKRYVGSHSTHIINDNYLGSGIIIKKAIKKYGKDNFSREILKICKNRDEAVLLEEYYINEYNTLNPFGYNISPYGNVAFPGSKNPMYGKNPWNKGKQMKEESKEKLSKTLKEKYKNGYISPRKGTKHSNETKKIISEKTKERLSNKENHHFFGKKLSKKHVEKLMESHKGQVPWNKGKKGISEETREKMRLAKLGKKRSDEIKRKISKSMQR